MRYSYKSIDETMEILSKHGIPFAAECGSITVLHFACKGNIFWFAYKDGRLWKVYRLKTGASFDQYQSAMRIVPEHKFRVTSVFHHIMTFETFDDYTEASWFASGEASTGSHVRMFVQFGNMPEYEI